MLVLIVGDSPDVGALIDELRDHGLVPAIATSEYAALRLLETSDLALAVIVGGEEVGQRLWASLAAHEVPAVISARCAGARPPAQQQVAAVLLPEGSTPQEIRAACLAMVPRRHRLDEPEALDCGPLTLDLRQQSVTVDGREIDLPPKEFQILRHLMLQEGSPLSSHELMSRVWSDRAIVTTEDVHRHVYRLRGAIGEHDRTEPLIVNRRGFGYAITQPVRVRSRAMRSGTLDVLGPLGAVWAWTQAKALRWRAELAYPYRVATLCLEHAAVVLGAMAVAAGTLLGPTSLSASAIPTAHAYASLSDGSTEHAAPTATVQTVAARENRAVRVASPPAVPADISVGVNRDPERISLRRRISSWISRTGVAEEGDDVWLSCDPTSLVYRSACWAFDRASEPAAR